MQHTGKTRTDLLPLIRRTGTLQKKLDSLFFLSGSMHHWSICLLSVVIQHLTSRMLFCPSHTHSLGGRFQLIRLWMPLSSSKVFYQSSGPLVKSDCHSKINWDLINLLRYSAVKELVSSAVHRHSGRNTHTKLNIPVGIIQLHFLCGSQPRLMPALQLPKKNVEDCACGHACVFRGAWRGWPFSPSL